MLLACSSAYRTLVILENHVAAHRATLPSSAPGWPVDVRVLLHGLNERLVKPGLSVGAMQRELGLRDHNVASRFAECVGLPPKQYLVHYRMELAKRLLRDERLTNVPIMQIGLAVGYDEPRSFTKMFKKRVGCTPSQYRQSSH